VVTNLDPTTGTLTHGGPNYTAVVSGTGIAFVDGGAGNDSITDSNNGLAVFTVGDVLVVSGTTNNDGTYTALTVAAGTIEVATASLTAEGAGSTFHLISGSEYELHRWLDPDDPEVGLLGCINRALTRRLYYHTPRCPITLVTDGDMETSGIGNWTGTNLGTEVKSTTAATVFSGTQSYHMVTNAANGYGVSDAVNVIENEGYYVAAIVRAADATSTPNVVVYDVTNAATITTIDLSSTTGVNDIQMEWCMIAEGFTVPSGCKQVQIRLLGEENGADLYWDSVWLIRQAQRQLILPSWLVAPDLFVSVERVTGTWPRAFNYTKLPVNSKDIQFAAAEADHAIIKLGRPGTYKHVLDAWRPYSAFTTGASIDDTESRMVHEDWAIAAGRVEALALLRRGAGLNVYPDVEQAYGEALADYVHLSRLYKRKEPRAL